MAESSSNVWSVDDCPDLSICSGLLSLTPCPQRCVSAFHTHVHTCVQTHVHVFEFLDVVASRQMMKRVCNQCTASCDEMCHRVGNVVASKCSQGLGGKVIISF